MNDGKVTQGRLTFYACYGRDLPDRDKGAFCDSDPYMKYFVNVYHVCSNSYTKVTRTVHDNKTLNGMRIWTLVSDHGKNLK